MQPLVMIIGKKCKCMIEKIPFDLSGFTNSIVRKSWLLQRAFNWQLIMPHTINGIMGIFISQYCQEITFGDYSMNELSVLRYGSQQRFYAGLEEIDNIVLKFLAPVDNTVIDYFSGWKELIISKEGYYFPKSSYKKNIYAVTYDRSGIQSVGFEFSGCFPKTRPKYSLSYSAEGLQGIEIVISVDKIVSKSIIGGLQQKIIGIAGAALGKVTDAIKGGTSNLNL